MTFRRLFVPFLVFVVGCLVCSMHAQTSSSALSLLPHVIKYNGVLKEADGRARSGSIGVIFAIYDKEDGVAPVLLETQSVTADENGHYYVLLGSTKAEGLPTSIFSSGEARWIGVQAEGQAEQPRTLLVSVPYALKAGDADTLGGKPLSAFLMADSSSATSSKAQRLAEASSAHPETTAAINNGASNGTLNFLAKFDGPSTVVNSGIFENNGNVGIGTQTPTQRLEVNGAVRILTPGGSNFDSVSPGFLFFAGNTDYKIGFDAAFGSRGYMRYNVDARDTVHGHIFSAGPAGAQTDLMLIRGDGNVGIGTTTPSTKLEVNGSIRMLTPGGTNFSSTSPGFLFFAGNTDYKIGFDSVFGSKGYIRHNVDAADSIHGHIFSAGAAGAQTDLMLIAGNGNVGIGTTNPAATLDVNGQIRAANGIKFADASTQTTAVPSNCAAQQVPKWSGTAWACAAGGGGGATVFDGSSGANTAIVTVNQHGAGVVDPDPISNTPPAAIFAATDSNTGFTAAVVGKATGSNGIGLLGLVTSGPPSGTDTDSSAIIGLATSTTGKTRGVQGTVYSPDGQAGQFKAVGTGTALQASTGPDVGNQISELTVDSTGIRLSASSINLQGVTGPSAAISLGGATTVNGLLTAQGGINTPTITGHQVTGNVAITGGLTVTGNISGGSLTKPGGTFKIDHPLDPAGKFLYHSFVESPDMMNIYNGVVTLNSKGQAWITMPDWFEALNMDFRYQLTSIGRFAPVFIAREMTGNRFKISGGRANGKVSWQVTGIRHDAWADAHRVQVEEVKSPADQGTYLSPELFTKPGSDKVAFSDHPKH